MLLDFKSSSNSKNVFLSFEVQNTPITGLAKSSLVLFSHRYSCNTPSLPEVLANAKVETPKLWLPIWYSFHHMALTELVINQIGISSMIPSNSSLVQRKFKKPFFDNFITL